MSTFQRIYNSLQFNGGKSRCHIDKAMQDIFASRLDASFEDTQIGFGNLSQFCIDYRQIATDCVKYRKELGTTQVFCRKLEIDV